MQSTVSSVDTRRSTFKDLTQACCLGTERTKINSVFDLFEWTEEGKCHLSDFPWKGNSIAGTLKNRKHRHLKSFLELTHTLAIAPGQNCTENPVSEWESKYFGE